MFRRENNIMSCEKKSHINDLRLKIVMTVSVVTLFSFMLLFWGGVETVIKNKESLPFGPMDAMIPLFLIFVIFSIITIAIILFFWRFKCGRFSEIALSLFLSLSITMWLQVAFMNRNIGILDGEELYFSEIQLILNILIWLVIPILILAMRKWKRDVWKKGIIFISATLFIMQFASFVSLLPAISDSSRVQGYRANIVLSRDSEFLLSENENTVIFVLDRMGARLLYNTMKEFEHLQYMFRDFTRFDNSASLYDGTFPTMNYLLTRQRFDFSRPTREHLYYSWIHPDVVEFYGALREANYRIHILADPNWIALCASQLTDIADNLKDNEYFKINYQALVSNVFRMSAFRYSPLVFKENLLLSESDFENTVVSNRYSFNDPLFYERLKNIGISLKSEKNMFVFYHLVGSHRGSPATRINEFAIIDLEATEHQQTAGALWIVNEYMNQMRELGIYDSSNIVILADHGTGLSSGTGFMIKRAGARQDAMLISDAPISHEDFWATLVDIMNLETRNFGQSVFNVMEDIRVRETIHWIWYPGFPNTNNHYNGVLISTYTEHVFYCSVARIEDRDGRRFELSFSRGLNNIEIVPIYDSFYGGDWER